ncbi:MAG TPA: ATP-binding cassette domain-containing protein [Vicinamibacteria bacterium]|jgi:osmoprotectant transport system ATP-binding protein|nr:ATP-binding cassette domain-containing protein [Vicinamibacteria bacterium]
MPPPAVELADVRKRYPTGAVALDGVSLAVEQGRVLVLLGTSGSGKTTAVKTINRLVEPDSGRVSVVGRDVREWDPIRLRRSVGYVIQEAGLLPHMSVADNVALVPRLLGWDEERRSQRARELLKLVGLDPDRYGPLRPAQLSGGERQRVGVARALAADPPVLLMDEPFGALDPLTRRRLQDEFRELQSRLAKTVVLVTHDVPEALRLADEVAVMDRGRVVQQGPPREIKESPRPGFVQSFVAAALP